MKKYLAIDETTLDAITGDNIAGQGDTAASALADYHRDYMENNGEAPTHPILVVECGDQYTIHTNFKFKKAKPIQKKEGK